MEINTPKQNKSKYTTVFFMNKLVGAPLQFGEKIILPVGEVEWPSELSKHIEIKVPNMGMGAIVDVAWRFREVDRGVSYIRVSGKWRDEEKNHTESFLDVYDLKHPSKMVYNKSGAEIKSVISNNDVVKIKLPAKQIHIVHIGKSQYKVALK